jgi:hypothetical protein
MFPPFQLRGGKIYSFGVEVLGEEEQFRMIERNRQINVQRLEPVDVREKNVKRCITKNCTGKAREPLNYHCDICLANILVRSRDNSRGAEILIEFNGGDGGNTVNKFPGELVLSISMNGKRLFLNNLPVDGKFSKTTDKDRLHKFTVFGDFNLGENVLNGLFSGHILGRYACKSIVMGETCHSIDDNYQTNNFHSSIILPGICGWRENDEQFKKGKIEILEYCPGCYRKRAYKKVDNPKREVEILKESRKLLVEENVRLRKIIAMKDEEILNLKLCAVKITATNPKKN